MSAIDSSTNGGAPGRAADRGSDTIDSLTVALGQLRRGAAALSAENRELRAEIAGLQLAAAAPRSSDAPMRELGKLVEMALPTGYGAPGAARTVITHCLTGLVTQRVLGDVLLLVSELVTNSVDHGELAAADAVLLRIYVAADALRLEIENPGVAGVVAARPPVPEPRGGGLGLQLVDRVAVRWGVSRNRTTNVWFEIDRS